MISIKKGNKNVFTILVEDNDGDTVTDLATSTEIYYMIKTNKTDTDIAALVSLSKTAGEIEVDTPSTGYLTISIAAADTENIDVTEQNVFYHAAQIEYPASDRQEINLSQGNTVKIIQDIIRG